VRTVIMTEDGPELVQLVDGAVPWPPLSVYGPPTPQPLRSKPRDESTSYEILVGPTTIRRVSARCARSDDKR
jgi:hypothetical protein